MPFKGRERFYFSYLLTWYNFKKNKLLPANTFQASLLEDISNEHTSPNTLLMYDFKGREMTLAIDIARGYTPKKLERFAKLISKTE